MKRADALQGLSRDHHRTLVVALRLRRAEPETAVAVRREILEFWHGREHRHIGLEETVLLPAAARAAPSPDLEAALTRMQVEHVLIRERIAELEGERPEKEPLRALGRRLADHVGFEERVLFPLVERELSPERLDELARALGVGRGDGP